MANETDDSIDDDAKSGKEAFSEAVEQRSVRRETTKIQNPKRSAAYYAMVFFVSIVICLLFYETVLLIAVGMMPTGTAYLIDSKPGRYITKTVAWANFSGCMILVFNLFGSDRSFQTALELMSDPMSWMIVLVASAVGWCIYYIIPGFVRRYLDVSLEMRKKSLSEEIESYEKEWGEEIRANSPLEELQRLQQYNKNARIQKTPPENETPQTDSEEKAS